MFVRTKTDRSRTYLQIVESYREDGRVRQRVICTLGRLEELQARGQIDGVIKSLAKFSGSLKGQDDFAQGKLKAGRVTRIGPDLILDRLWQELGLDEILGRLSSTPICRLL